MKSSIFPNNPFSNRKLSFETLEKRDLLSVSSILAEFSFVESSISYQSTPHNCYCSNSGEDIIAVQTLIQASHPMVSDVIQNAIETIDDFFSEEFSETLDCSCEEYQLPTSCNSDDDELFESEAWNDIVDEIGILTNEGYGDADIPTLRSGGSGSIPYISGGTDGNYYFAEYFFSADDAQTSTFSSAHWFANPEVGTQLSYSIQTALNHILVAIDENTGEFTLKPKGVVGSGSFTITASNGIGSCSVPVHVYCGRVVGYTLEEQTYGGTWSSVWDSGEDWKLLWKENQYRWKPIFDQNCAPPSHNVSSITVMSRPLGSQYQRSIFAYETSVPQLSSGGGSYQPPDINWPNAVGTPLDFGENDISISVGVIGCNWPDSGHVCIDQNSANLNLVKATPSSYQPRIGVNEIAQVSWDSVDSGNRINLETYPENSSEERFFPELPLDQCGQSNPVVENSINLKVTLSYAIPFGMTGRVTLDYFDPLNPYGVGRTINSGYIVGKRDNYGDFSPLEDEDKILTVTSSHGIQISKTLYVMNPHAGDNYIGVVHPNPIINSHYYVKDSSVVEEDEESFSSQIMLKIGSQEGTTIFSPLPSSLQTSVLTVWRTLWVELDQMKRNQIINGELIADLPELFDLSNDQMKRACIKLQIIDGNVNPTIEGEQVILQQNESNYIGTGRNSPTPSNIFWTVRMIGVFQLNSISVLGRCNNNTIFIANEAIKTGVINWNNANPTKQVSYSNAKRYTALHELGHAFSLQHSLKGIMQQEIDYEHILECGFTIDDIRTIQSQAQPVFTS